MLDQLSYYEKLLSEKIADGDEIAFADLYALYAPRLKAYAFKFTHSVADTEEILQESFLKIWLHREKLPQITQLQAWIYKVVARECLQWLRKQAGWQKQVDKMVDYHITATVSTPEEIVKWQELSAAIQTAIEKLPAIRQKIYLQNREQGLKPAAIALALQMPVGTVKNHLSAAVRSIREHLINDGYQLIPLVSLVIAPLF